MPRAIHLDSRGLITTLLLGWEVSLFLLRAPCVLCGQLRRMSGGRRTRAGSLVAGMAGLFVLRRRARPRIG